MKIKEAAKVTHLSEKSIRFYETKGLITVQRKNNGYRDYDDKSIQRLHAIRLMRMLGMGIETIRDCFDHPESWKDALNDTVKKDNQYDVNTLVDLVSDMPFSSVVQDASGLLDTWTDESYQEALAYKKSPSLFSTIIISLILSGPILWLLLASFVSLHWIDFRVLVPLALCSMVLITLLWSYYFRNRNKKLKRSNTLISILLIIVVFMFYLLLIIAMSLLQIKLFTDDKSYLIVGNYQWLQFFVIVAMILQLVTIVFGMRYEKNKDPDFEDSGENWGFIKRYYKWVLGVNCVLVYVFITSVTVVHEDGTLIRFSPINITGTTHNVESVTVGYNKGIFVEYLPVFSMKLHTEDFTVDIGGASSINDHDDTYVELENLAQLFVHNGIPLKATNTNDRTCTIDRYYCQRFNRILALAQVND